MTAHPASRALLAERIYLAENSAPRVVGGEHKFQNLSLIVNWAWTEKRRKNYANALNCHLANETCIAFECIINLKPFRDSDFFRKQTIKNDSAIVEAAAFSPFILTETFVAAHPKTARKLRRWNKTLMEDADQ